MTHLEEVNASAHMDSADDLEAARAWVESWEKAPDLLDGIAPWDAVDCGEESLLASLRAIPTTPAHVRTAEEQALWLQRRRKAREEPADESVYRGAGIRFEGNSGWAAYSDSWAASMSQAPKVAKDLRLMFAAMARVNPRSGVAYFHKGELAEILGCSPESLRQALRSARDRGYVLRKSTSTKVWLDRQSIQRGDTGR